MKWYREARSPESPPEDLSTEDVSRSVNPLEGIPYVIIGGAAMGLQGMDRSFSDVDVAVSPQFIPEIAQRVSDAGGEVSSLATGGIHISMPGTDMDVLSLEHIGVDPSSIDGVDSPYGKLMSKPWIVLTKMSDTREKDFADIVSLLGAMSESEMEQTRVLVKQYLPNDVEDLESYVEMSRMYSSDPIMAWIEGNCSMIKTALPHITVNRGLGNTSNTWPSPEDSKSVFDPNTEYMGTDHVPPNWDTEDWEEYTSFLKSYYKTDDKRVISVRLTRDDRVPVWDVVNKRVVIIDKNEGSESEPVTDQVSEGLQVPVV